MTLIEQLAAELGAPASVVRDALLGIEQAEAVQPTYLTTDAAGKVSANFTGHVKAAGLDLDAGPATASSPLQEVDWLRHTDGVKVALLRAWQDNAGLRDLMMTVSNDDQGARSGFEASQFPPGAAGNIGAAYVWCNGNKYLLKRDDGVSDMGRCALAANNQSLGTNNNFTVRSDGLVVVIGAGTGWNAGTGLAQTDLVVDGSARVSGAKYFNVSNNHETLPPMVWTFSNSPGSHTCWVGAGAGLSFDVNDRQTLIVLELPSRS